MDSDPAMRNLFQEILELDGFDVAAVESVDEARKIVTEGRVELLLIDAALPDDAGWDLGSWTCETCSSTRVVYLVSIHESVVKRRLEKGRHPHFVRPFEMEELRELAARVMNPKPSS